MRTQKYWNKGKFEILEHELFQVNKKIIKLPNKNIKNIVYYMFDTASCFQVQKSKNNNKVMLVTELESNVTNIIIY